MKGIWLIVTSATVLTTSVAGFAVPSAHQRFSSYSCSESSKRHEISFPNRSSSVTHSPTRLSATISPPMMIKSLHSDSFYVLSSVLFLSTFGLKLEQKTTLGKALSAPLGTMALALILANLGFMPFSSPIYDFINQYLVSLAIPLLLFESNLKQVFTSTGPLLFAFFVGALSTVLATLVTYPLIPLGSLSGWKIASALAARHIGGAINFVAVAETLSIDASSISAAIAADNVVVALYFAFLFGISKKGYTDDISAMNDDDLDLIAVREIPTNARSSDMSMSSLAISLTTSACLVTLGKVLTSSLLFLPKSTSALPMISILTVLAATCFPSFFETHRTTGTSIGVIFMQMFFAASGATGSIKLVLEKAPSLFAFSAISIFFHFVSLMAIGRLIFRIKPNLLYLASNANVGGPTTAAAMAQAKGWNQLVLPALLVGILGYATATPIALALSHVLKGMMMK